MTKGFRKVQTDDSKRSAMQLSVADQVLVQPVIEAGVVALYLSTVTDKNTGHKNETQWALTLDRAEWLAKNLKNAIKDVRWKRN